MTDQQKPSNPSEPSKTPPEEKPTEEQVSSSDLPFVTAKSNSALLLRLLTITIIAGALVYVIVTNKPDSPSSTSTAENTEEGDEYEDDYSEADSTAAAGVEMDTDTLKIVDIKEGTGEPFTEGMTVVVHYKGMLTDGTVFDESYGRGQPFPVPLGAGRVIPGWEQGLLGMKVGGERKLVIPPSLAYGEQGVPPTIPPSSTLIFEIKAVSIQDAAAK